jgi:hypothetical protein
LRKDSWERPFTVAAVAMLAMGLAMVAVDGAFPAGGNIWKEWVTEQSTLVYFCEPASVEAVFRHKVDTYTNLGFFFWAVVVLVFGQMDRRRGVGGVETTQSVERNLSHTPFVAGHPIWSTAFGLAMLSTFLGSTFFHASLTRDGEMFDLAGVYAAALLPGFFNVHRLVSLWKRRRIPAWPFLVAWGVAWLVTSLLIFRLSSRVVVPGGLVLIGLTGFLLWLQIRPRRGWWFAGGSVILTAVAAVFFVLDIRKVGCDPGSWYQAHGIWHLVIAGAAGAYYGFMRKLE